LVSVRDQGYFFVTGPDVIREVTGEDVSLDELGAPTTARYGNLHQVVNSEAEAFSMCGTISRSLPSNCFDKPPVVNPGLEPDITPTTWNSTRSFRIPTRGLRHAPRSCCGIFDDGDFLDVAAQGASPSSPGMPASTAIRSA